MLTPESARTLLKYSDWANDFVLRAATPLQAVQLDQPFQMARGSLRSTLMHLWSGEHVWVQRWQGRAETPWPDENERMAVSTMLDRIRTVNAERDVFLETLTETDLARVIRYRDSKGSFFVASLADMIIQMIVHSTHHRSQIVNMLRNVGVTPPPELDYMIWVRKPA